MNAKHLAIATAALHEGVCVLSGLAPDGSAVAVALNFERIQREDTLASGADIDAAEAALVTKLETVATATAAKESAEATAAAAKVTAVDGAKK